METTFITIHDLSPDARIIYSSDSIVDILGYSAEEVINRSCWEFFHPDELPLAKSKHGRGVVLDKAAVLSYCRMMDCNGQWVGCEVVFTVVYDVLVGCTSIYKRGVRSQSRAQEAPVVRRLFSSSPRDPRYHMLQHLSSRFSLDRQIDSHEPRAALFLNRYTRTLTIMYATNGLASLLGISGDEMKGKSFYFCIQENCLPDAVRCLENAKANDSIAYLRFWWRDPRTPDEVDAPPDHMDIDSGSFTPASNSDSDGSHRGSRTHLRSGAARRVLEESQPSFVDSQPVSSEDSFSSPEAGDMDDSHHLAPPHTDSRTSSGEDSATYTHEAVFGTSAPRNSSASSTSTPAPQMNGARTFRRPIELEAVVSCTSDGLVVCLRHAHPVLPQSMQQPGQEMAYSNGLFAVPWAAEPMMPAQAPLKRADTISVPPMTSRLPTAVQAKAHTRSDFMQSICDIAVFAWALTGINGSLADYSKGKPCGESQPASGLPIWNQDRNLSADQDNSTLPPLHLPNKPQNLPSMSSTGQILSSDPLAPFPTRSIQQVASSSGTIFATQSPSVDPS